MITENAIDWTIPWKEEGREEGREIGRQEGREIGRQEGEVAVLLRMLRRKYGSLSPEVEDRIRKADAQQLLDWADRFVTADTLEEIFDGASTTS